MIEVKLVVLTGKHSGKTIPISGRKFFIGRAEDCNLRTPSDLISRHHCAILVDREKGVAAVRDFGSRNGTFVNGEPAQPQCKLRNGDRLKVGNLEFEFQMSSAPAPAPQPAVHPAPQVASPKVNPVDEPHGPPLDDDLDLTAWFGEQTAQPSAGAKPDATTTSISTVSPTASPAPTAPTAGAVPSEQEQNKSDTKQVPRKGPPKKPNVPSSREAAAMMLKKFFRGF